MSVIRAQEGELARTAAAASDALAEARQLAREYYRTWRDELGRHVDLPHADGLPSWLTGDDDD